MFEVGYCYCHITHVDDKIIVQIGVWVEGAVSYSLVEQQSKVVDVLHVDYTVIDSLDWTRYISENAKMHRNNASVAVVQNGCLVWNARALSPDSFSSVRNSS